MSRSGRYHVSFTTTKPVNTKKTKSTDPHSTVGIDLGCVNTITLSTGEVFNFSRPDLDKKYAKHK